MEFRVAAKLFSIGLLALALIGCGGEASQADQYPGDEAFTEKVQELRRDVRDDDIDVPWGPEPNSGLSKRQLCERLVSRHFTGTSRGQTQTNANWLNCPDLDRAGLLRACVGALTRPRGFRSAAGWAAWAGHHQGTWYGDNYDGAADNAHWREPSPQRSKLPNDNDEDGDRRVYDFQDVEFGDRRGWNQSHPEVPYVWGWDPKNNGNENGDIGTHLGFPFEVGPCKFIVWLTPKEAFLEGINTAAKQNREVGGRSLNGYPKTSTGLGGRGQWVVDR